MERISVASRGGDRAGDATSDISAPAENVFRARVDAPGGHSTAVGPGQGTSFAVAITAGIAALWLAHHGRERLAEQARARGEFLQDTFRRLVAATANRPADWESGQLGAGIVDASALLAADPAVAVALDARLRSPTEADHVESQRRFVEESVSAEAAAANIDWSRYGPEIVANILQARLAHRPGATDAVEPLRLIDGGAGLSPTLRKAIVGTRLADHLGVQ